MQNITLAFGFNLDYESRKIVAYNTSTVKVNNYERDNPVLY